MWMWETLKKVYRRICSAKELHTLLVTILVSSPFIYFYSLYNQLGALEKAALVLLIITLFLIIICLIHEIHERLIARGDRLTDKLWALHKEGVKLRNKDWKNSEQGNKEYPEWHEKFMDWKQRVMDISPPKLKRRIDVLNNTSEEADKLAEEKHYQKRGFIGKQNKRSKFAIDVAAFCEILFRMEKYLDEHGKY